MKVYPKIPRYDHPVVPSDFFEASDLTLLEKVDGSSFRFTLYDERFAEAYPERVVEAADGDGSLVFGTRKTIRGNHRDSFETVELRRRPRLAGDRLPIPDEGERVVDVSVLLDLVLGGDR